ncbi:MAG: DUF2849 domain-containing protein [Pseudomonadota bacterium]
MNAFAITANKLDNGLVVYLAKGSTDTHTIWDRDLQKAQCFADAEQTEAFLARATQGCDTARISMVGPYVIAVQHDENQQLSAVKFKEIIRHLGPTVAKDHNDRPIGLQAA